MRTFLPGLCLYIRCGMLWYRLVRAGFLYSRVSSKLQKFQEFLPMQPLRKAWSKPHPIQNFRFLIVVIFYIS